MLQHHVRVGVCVALLAVAPFAAATPGDRDASYGNGGIVHGNGSFSSGGGLEYGYSIAVQNDGKVVLGGQSHNQFAVIRYLNDGTPDGTFGSGGLVTTPTSGGGRVNRVLTHADGSVLAGGEDLGHGMLARYLDDGSLDPSFGGGSYVFTRSGGVGVVINAILEQPDGRIVVVGVKESSSPPFSPALARYAADGSLDTSFGTGGFVILSSVTGWFTSALLQPDGRIVAAGTSTGDLIARFETDGSFDGSFGSGGMAVLSVTGGAVAIVRQADGKLVYLGPTFTLARVDTSGALDTSFGIGGSVTTTFGFSQYSTALVQQPDGKLLAAGRVEPTSRTGVARYDADGALDPTFGIGGKAVTVFRGYDNAAALALQSDGRILGGGDIGPIHSFFSFRLLGGTCGNGVTEGGEDCDDGNTAPGDGCDAHCCSADVDGDGICDAIDPCVGGPAVTVGKIQVQPSLGGHLTDKGQLTFTPPVGIDPISTGVRLILRDTAGTLFDVRIPPGAYVYPPGKGWRPNHTVPVSQWTYLDKTNGQPAETYGIKKVLIQDRSARVPGQVRFVVNGHVGPYPAYVENLPLSGTVVLDPPTGARCGDVTFPGPPPAPACVVRPADVICK